jgi:hypothetical protein
MVAVAVVSVRDTQIGHSCASDKILTKASHSYKWHKRATFG